MATINVICDDRMIDRQLPLLEELIRQKAPYVLWPIVEDRHSVVASINKSHKQIVRFAKENNLPEILIGEDDLMFPADDGYQYFLSKKPDDYDLYLAATYTPPITNNIVCGFHLYFIHSRFYDAFLETPDNVHIDTQMSQLDGKYVFCYPMAALQRPGRSANNPGEKVNYNNQLKAEDVYGKFK